MPSKPIMNNWPMALRYLEVDCQLDITWTISGRHTDLFKSSHSDVRSMLPDVDGTFQTGAEIDGVATRTAGIYIWTITVLL